MRHDLEEFLDECGLRSGPRRMAIYLKQLFAPDAAAAGGEGAGDDQEALDFDRRAPLSMRIEPAAEPERERRLPQPSAKGAGVNPVSPPVALPASRVPAAAASAGPGSAPAGRRSRGSWIVLATFIVLGIGAMVFLTLR